MPKHIEKFTPVGPRLLVEKVDLGEVTVGRLVIVQNTDGSRRCNPVVVRVIHPGTGRLNEYTGKREEPRFSEGHLLVLANMNDLTLRVDGVELYVITEDAVLGGAEVAEVQEPAAIPDPA